ncbi:inner membrane protein [compost metagenome]
MTRTLGFKLGIIALLMLLLMIPLMLIEGLIDERQLARDGVLANIAQSSSYSQRITGPILVVPYKRAVREWKTYEQTGQRHLEEREVSSRLYFLPERFSLVGSVDTELRARGIYKARLYKSDSQISGQILVPANYGISEDLADYRFEQPFLAVGISDIRGIGNALKLGRLPFRAALPGGGHQRYPGHRQCAEAAPERPVPGLPARQRRPPAERRGACAPCRAAGRGTAKPGLRLRPQAARHLRPEHHPGGS